MNFLMKYIFISVLLCNIMFSNVLKIDVNNNLLNLEYSKFIYFNDKNQYITTFKYSKYEKIKEKIEKYKIGLKLSDLKREDYKLGFGISTMFMDYKGDNNFLTIFEEYLDFNFNDYIEINNKILVTPKILSTSNIKGYYKYNLQIITNILDNGDVYLNIDMDKLLYKEEERRKQEVTIGFRIFF